jgi:hypothetical protein
VGIMGLNKKQLLVALAVAFGVTGGSVLAAEISNLSGQTCGDAIGTWHFVNNQTGGAPSGTLTATWSSGNACTVSASSVTNKTQHFYCTASGTLLSASSDLPGKLVLSDWTCTDVKEPPVCDPKKEKC